MKLRLGADAYSGQFQQRPAPGGGGKFRKEYFRYYRKMGHPTERYELFKADGTVQLVDVESCRRFAVMDPAAAEKEAGNRPCYTVIQVWDLTPKYDLVLVHQFREQVSAPAR